MNQNSFNNIGRPSNLNGKPLYNDRYGNGNSSRNYLKDPNKINGYKQDNIYKSEEKNSFNKYKGNYKDFTENENFIRRDEEGNGEKNYFLPIIFIVIGLFIIFVLLASL